MKYAIFFIICKIIIIVLLMLFNNIAILQFNSFSFWFKALFIKRNEVKVIETFIKMLLFYNCMMYHHINCVNLLCLFLFFFVNIPSNLFIDLFLYNDTNLFLCLPNLYYLKKSILFYRHTETDHMYLKMSFKMHDLPCLKIDFFNYCDDYNCLI